MDWSRGATLARCAMILAPARWPRSLLDRVQAISGLEYRNLSTPEPASPRSARSAEPSLERLAHVGFGNRLGRRHAGRSTQRPEQRFQVRAAAGHLERVARSIAWLSKPAVLARASPVAAMT